MKGMYLKSDLVNPVLTVRTGMFKQAAVPLPQAFTGVTQMKPPLNAPGPEAGPKATVILFVVEEPVTPPGNDQMYELAPATGAIE